ncbi:MAG: low specificity L-threonine aldolase [Desulfobacterales bacterium]|nr:low specificity L-threonine aldolase [Desulfobacterales bacterium]
MTDPIKKGFASDNNSGVHPNVLKAFSEVNKGHTVAYGDDPYTEIAVNKFKELLGDVEVFFVFNGTSANVLSIKAATNSFNAVICAGSAHINVDECGAPEKFCGCKLLSVETDDGKLTVEKIKKHMHGFGFEHHSQPKVISITQCTELGTIYSVSEIKNIAEYAHMHDMILHMDGARISNAAAYLNVSLKEMITETGVDILSFGGTKNGMMFGEAVIFFKKELAENFKYIRKQSMQLFSKMRFISAQFNAIFENDLYLKSAKHANEMAKILAERVRDIKEVKLTQKVESNCVFAIIPEKYIQELQEHFSFYVWNHETSEVRWVTSFDTTIEDIDRFCNLLIKVLE